MAFLRIDDEPIRTRNLVYEPDLVLVLDPSLLRLVDVTSGLKEDGVLVTNTKHSGREIREELGFKHKIATVNANKIAKEELGVMITNTTMIGSLLKVREIIPLDAILDPLKKRFGRIAEKNVNALKRAFKETSVS